MIKLTDEVAACNMIKGIREYNKKNRISKAITIKTNIMENKSTLSCRLHIRFNRKTENISIDHAITWKRKRIFPTTNQKLQCTNQHALDMLQAKRDRDRRRYHATKLKEKGDVA